MRKSVRQVRPLNPSHLLNQQSVMSHPGKRLHHLQLDTHDSSQSRNDNQQRQESYPLCFQNRPGAHWPSVICTAYITSSSKVVESLTCLLMEGDEIKRRAAKPQDNDKDERRKNPWSSSLRQSKPE